jgi:hypothetical protein
MEYVRICDTYGVGFYYIPGTETCLKVSGYVRYDIGIGARGLDSFDKEDIADNLYDFYADENDTYYKRARFQLRLDSRTETELGTLRTYAAVNFQYDVNQGVLDNYFDDDDFAGFPITTTADEFGIDHAYIELGGFRVGKTDSLFSTFTGYSSGVSNDGLVPYGPFGTHQIAYTFTGGNGFTAAIALEEGGGGEGAYDLVSYALDDYVPHVVGGVGWTGGWGGVSLVAGYDAVYGEGAIKGRVDFNASDAISLFVMGAWASNDDDIVIAPGVFDVSDAQNYYAPWGGEWAFWVGGAWKFNEKTAFNFEVGYDDFENFAVAANIDYELVQNFHVIPEITYEDNFDDDFDDNNDEEWGGFLRLQANFGG